MRSANMHLTSQELQSLLFGTIAVSDGCGDTSDPVAQAKQQHLRACAICESLADEYRDANTVLGKIGARDAQAPPLPIHGKCCVPEELWPRIAAGLMQYEEVIPYLSHASQCDWCGLLLKESMQLSDEILTQEEEETLLKLPSASSGWQREFAACLCGKKLDKETDGRGSHPNLALAVQKAISARYWLVPMYRAALVASLIFAAFLGIMSYRLSRQLKETEEKIYKLTQRYEEISQASLVHRVDYSTSSAPSYNNNSQLIQKRIERASNHLSRQLEEERLIAAKFEASIYKAANQLNQFEEKKASAANQKQRISSNILPTPVAHPEPEFSRMGFMSNPYGQMPYKGELPPVIVSRHSSIVRTSLSPKIAGQKILISQDVQAVQLSLETPVAPGTLVKVELLNELSEVVFTVQETTQRIANDNFIVATIGPEYLPSGNYILRVTIPGSQSVSSLYSFQVLSVEASQKPHKPPKD